MTNLQVNISPLAGPAGTPHNPCRRELTPCINAPQSRMAFRTSSAMTFSSADEISVMAQEVGHIVPSSSYPASKKVILALPPLNLARSW
jgi:hypothetical protein